jgi:hypothetical protein
MKIDPTEFVHGVNADHADEYRREHDFLHGQIAPAKERHDLLILRHLSLLEYETEENSRAESEHEPSRTGNFQWTHSYTLRKISRAMIVPEIIIA